MVPAMNDLQSVAVACVAMAVISVCIVVILKFENLDLEVPGLRLRINRKDKDT